MQTVFPKRAAISTSAPPIPPTSMLTQTDRGKKKLSQDKSMVNTTLKPGGNGGKQQIVYKDFWNLTPAICYSYGTYPGHVILGVAEIQATIRSCSVDRGGPGGWRPSKS